MTNYLDIEEWRRNSSIAKGPIAPLSKLERQEGKTVWAKQLLPIVNHPLVNRDAPAS